MRRAARDRIRRAPRPIIVMAAALRRCQTAARRGPIASCEGCRSHARDAGAGPRRSIAERSNGMWEESLARLVSRPPAGRLLRPVFLPDPPMQRVLVLAAALFA